MFKSNMTSTNYPSTSYRSLGEYNGVKPGEVGTLTTASGATQSIPVPAFAPDENATTVPQYHVPYIGQTNDLLHGLAPDQLSGGYFPVNSAYPSCDTQCTTFEMRDCVNKPMILEKKGIQCEGVGGRPPYKILCDKNDSKCYDGSPKYCTSGGAPGILPQRDIQCEGKGGRPPYTVKCATGDAQCHDNSAKYCTSGGGPGFLPGQEQHKCADGTLFMCQAGTRGCFDESPKYCAGHSTTPTHFIPNGHGHSTPTHFIPNGHGHSTPTHFVPNGHGHSIPTHFIQPATPTIFVGGGGGGGMPSGGGGARLGGMGQPVTQNQNVNVNVSGCDKEGYYY